MAEHSIKTGTIKDVTGEVNIAGGNLYKGYTAEQVLVLLSQITSTFQPKPYDGRCPYKGLDDFEEEDAELFFGRERLVEGLVGRLNDSRILFITGPSGSGKSSLVRAGLIPAWKRGALKELHSEGWCYETMKPGREPLEALALAFSRLKSPELANYFRDHVHEKNALHECAESVLSGRADRHFVLFVDQFEEVFTQINREEERQQFLNLLTHAVNLERGRVVLVLAMRSDFVSNCAAYPELNALLNRQSAFAQIGSMRPEELVSAIAQPALRVGLRVDPDLVAQIINDMQGEPGALPLMQFALRDLFDAQQAKGGLIALTLADYIRQGGIHKALERHADKAFAKLSENEQALARSLFGGLIEIGRGAQDTRRTALFDELVPANVKAEEVLTVVQRLADARLIITDEQAGVDTVTISHEKLIDAWPWLRRLVNENRETIALQNEIAGDAKEWEDHGRDPSYLYGGARLINAREQLGSKKLRLGGLAHEFVQAGHVKQRQGQFVLVGGTIIIIALLVFAVLVFSRQSSTNAQLAEQNAEIASTAQAASTFAVAQQVTAQANAEKAEKQAKIARAGELAAQSVEMREENFQISSLLGIEAFRSWDTVRSRGVLLDNINANPRLLRHLIGHTDGISSVAFSPDSKTLASGSGDKTIILWDVATGQPIAQPLTGHTDVVTTVAFSPDGETLASGSLDDTIILWDVATHQPIGQPLTGHAYRVSSIAFSPDGETLASGSWDNTIVLWDVATHQPIGQPFTGHTAVVSSIAFSPDGKTLASGSWNNEVILWDVAAGQPIGQPLIGHTNTVRAVTFSPDGRILASGSLDKTVILWDAKTGREIARIPDAGNVVSITFSPDGKILASGNLDDTIILWNAETYQPIDPPLTGHTNSINSVAFSPDGKTLASGSYDKTVILWDMATGLPIGQLLMGHTNAVSTVAFSPDGKTLASSSLDDTIILWDMATDLPMSQSFTEHTGVAYFVAFSPDGKTLASINSVDNRIVLRDMATYQPISQPFTGHTNAVSIVAFSPDGKTLASGSYDTTIILWDVATQQPIGQPLIGHTNIVSSVAFSPDGKTLASGSGDKTIVLWDVATGLPIGQPLIGHIDNVHSVAFSPDGKLLASGSADKTIILWDVATHQPIGQPLIGHINDVSSVAFSPDGKTLASGGIDGVIILWDVATHQSMGQPFIRYTAGVLSVAFSPDGKTLASGSGDKTIILWKISPQYWIEQSCQRVGRNFTREEWGRYFQNETHRKTCEQWPLESQVPVMPSPMP